MSTDHIWTTVAFTAAPAGWLAWRGSKHFALPGWLTQENQHGVRRVVPAQASGEGLVPAESRGRMLAVTGPGEEEQR
ncbi:hypothetical protein [Kocuria sp. SM24M-10]|uniref:hypothetical protein n=1 Tax=Kocuria sp. SM24M-10 TaxID=1660349 RepID=UPI00064A6737|nr:hypothetical protein [Kocuria sp. SM24M-10]KLU10622.1 hypothetical protein ABL57_05625 [Kocuria sp. SM24M-10]